MRRQEWSYDDLGRLATAVQYDATTAGNATDGIKYSYDAWGNLERFEQDRNSAVAASGGDEYDVSYTWVKATNGRNTLRKTNMVLPSSRSISYTYRTSGGLHDEEASRVSTVVDDTGTSGGGGSVTIAQYDYLGTGTLVRTRLNAIGCFSRVYDGTNAIVDLDRFNRITTNRWTKDLATDRDLYQTVLSYDRASNITSIEDNVHTGFDAKYSLDGLQRLTQTEEGTLSSGSITSKTRDQQWTLSHTGNWDRAKLDLNGDGDFSDTSEHDDTRSHNVVNELTARDTDSNSSNNFTLTYDAAGNLSDDGEHYEYEYDAFYRLRKVKNTSTQALVAEYRYNALNHRIGVHEDSDTDGDVDSNDKWYYDAFDERWRLLARVRESDTAPKEDFVPHQAGDSGHGTSSYIDLVICRNRDADTAWTAASDGTLEERSYLLQNWRADVSAVVSGSGLLKEWVKYSSYGVPIGLPGGDTDSDGDCDANDITQVQTWITASAYDVRGDVDLDGDVDASDKSELQTNYQGITLGRGVLSSSATASRKGYAGYEGLTNLAGSQWLARNRVLMAELGRWERRDPLEYIDGLNLSLYSQARPVEYRDSYGESVETCGPVNVLLTNVSTLTLAGLPPQSLTMGLVTRDEAPNCQGCKGRIRLGLTVGPDTPRTYMLWHGVPPPKKSRYPQWYIGGVHRGEFDGLSEPRKVDLDYSLSCGHCLGIPVVLKPYPRSTGPLTPFGATPMQVSATIHLCCGFCSDSKHKLPTWQLEMENDHGFAGPR